MAGESGHRTRDDHVPGHLRRQNRPLSACRFLEDIRSEGVTAAEDEHADARLAGDIAALSGHSGFKPGHSVIEIRDRRGMCHADAPTVRRTRP